ncbi:ABC transporter permease [Fulvivirgaceae bacterium PWU4]|uniref:ABC transporter permease n=1 Tax=Chryseosolibacter histidini TaxID=2782349 RepID=A0AAP2DMW1_9BACT|nr:ABC transporter permease [Chryseosolibacter histidini]MBT1699206.1 ABC transporter permease [Chryseosolibacter histidini]
MIKHHLLIIYRSFRKFRGTFLVNVAGLSVGLAATLLICLWVMDELSVDKFHEHNDRLFQVMMNIERPEGIETNPSTPEPTAKTLLEEFAEIENAVSVIQVPPRIKGLLSWENKSIKARQQFAGKEFFEIFSYKLLHGSGTQVLRDKNQLLLSDEMAIRLFGSAEAALGKTVEWNGGQYTGSYSVSGIFERAPENSTVQFDVLFCLDLFTEKNPSYLGWSNCASIAYVILKEETSVTVINEKLKGLMKAKAPAWNSTIFLRPYADQYLYNTYENGVRTGGRIAYVKLFSLIACFILIIACVNFMNLTTAKTAQRLKEIGVRKVMGARRRTLAFQYLGESLLVSFLSLAVAVLIVDLVLPEFNSITGKNLALAFDIRIILLFCSIALFTGIISGSYPALYLSSFNPAMVLRGKMHRALGELWTRKGLVVFQFAVSIILIVAVVVVYRQLGFIQSKNLGYNRDNVIYFPNEGPLRKNLESFLTEVKRIPGVVNASDLSFDLTGEHAGTYSIRWEGKRPEDSVSFANLAGDYDVAGILELQLKEGRFFSQETGNESANIIINEAAARIIGFTEPVGKAVRIWEKEKQIIGVVKDFHFESLYENVKPCFIQCMPNQRNVLVKIRAGVVPETLSQVEKLYKTYNAGFPFEYRFFDDDYQRLYTAEKRVATLAAYFAAIAVMISCLGLFALAAFTAEKRRKEIGIRKVLGSSEWGVVLLLSADFTGTVLVSVMIALPLSYFITSHWLDSFAFRIGMEWWYFVSAGAIALLVAWFTVAAQAVRAARVNPVKCLKEE